MTARFDAPADFRTRGHKVLITGGARNIGAAIANDTGPTCLGMAGDVTYCAQVDAVVAGTARALDGISTRVNNVGCAA